MATITLPARETSHPHMRALNILRDLSAVADLIELCFAQTMDNDGRRHVQEMRLADKENSFVRWANRAMESTSLPLTGFVWEEEGKIIGNVSLIPYKQKQQRVYLIANVAVHPQYRRQRIARVLTERAIQHAVSKNVRDVWLHVRDDNPAAIKLYKGLGFVERARRASWSAATDANAAPLSRSIVIAPRRAQDWQTQQGWLQEAYPKLIRWHRNWNFTALKPGLLNWLYAGFVDLDAQQWAAYEGKKMQAALAWLPHQRSEALFAAIGNNSNPEALTALLIHARRALFHLYPKIGLEFPAGLFDDAIQSAGFKAQRTLIWMQATL